ncbi:MULTISPECIES: antibiotic biosynthesis monooxygenase [unclassified Streptomyces]|uniref:antibiotic biosynthesis monooxygenase family protein n=1 Tax=unclassified Streptomyces TaxID=2593676 RepID=UPI00344E42D1
MSDQVQGLVSGIEPPYYAVVFTSLRTEDDNGYGETAVEMGELVKEIPGFLGYESARNPGGLGITVGYFRDEAAIAAWRGRVEHQQAQKRGRADWYKGYSVHVAKVERSYGFERG